MGDDLRISRGFVFERTVTSYDVIFSVWPDPHIVGTTNDVADDRHASVERVTITTTTNLSVWQVCHRERSFKASAGGRPRQRCARRRHHDASLWARVVLYNLPLAKIARVPKPTNKANQIGNRSACISRCLQFPRD
jgi:hypothetical protein